jgi:hypothetical protein
MMTRRAAMGLAAAAFILGGLATLTLSPVYAQPEPKGPTWKYGLNTRVRRGDESSFNKETRKVGIEVYQDENNGNLIYVSDTGSISVVPRK